MQRVILIFILSVVILPNFSFQSLAASTINSECGKGTLKGTEPTVEKYPWMASIYFGDHFANEPAEFYGTATIITDRHLLTVTNVVPSKHSNSSDILPTDFFAVVGGAYKVDGIIHYIKKIHKYYGTKEHPVLGGGLAIVQLVNKISDSIKPICLPKIVSNKDIHQENQSLTVVEWNSPSDNSSETPVLHEVNVNLQSDDYCQQFFEIPYPRDQLICGKCSEETYHKLGYGGPLMRCRNGKCTIVGVTDKNIGRSTSSESQDIPIYFLKTESFTHMYWITKMIKRR